MKVEFDPITLAWHFVRDDAPTDLTDDEREYVRYVVAREAVLLRAA